MIKGTPRSPVLTLILCLLTCGLYYFYYMFVVTEEVNRFTGKKEQDPAMDVILTLLTCGIWDIYWDYKMGKRMAEMTMMVGLPVTDNAILYLILNILGVGIINVVMQQETLNRVWSQVDRFGWGYGGPGGYPPPPNTYPPPPYYRQ